ncbi:MAG: serine hydrolase domain-containing protein [Bacteriovoracia bacterium]
MKKLSQPKLLLGLLGVFFIFIALFLFVNLTKIRLWITYPRNNEVSATDWYQKLEIVQGAEKELTPSILGTSESTVKKLLEATRFAKEANSLALVILHHGKVVLQQYQGDEDKVLNSMSMMKTILALLVGIAIDEGKITSETDLVSKYLIDWKDWESTKVRIVDLLQMASGLDFDNKVSFFSDLGSLHLGGNVTSFVSRPKVFEDPQKKYRYSNFDAEVVSVVLEKATGYRFSHYLQEKLWKPLAASDAKVWVDSISGYAKTYCCFFAKPRDWARVGQLILDKGKVDGKQIVSERWIKKMTIPSPLNKEYGYFLFIEKYGYKLAGRHEQRVYVLPKQDLVIVRMGENPEKVGFEWKDDYLPSLFK